jgi:TIR domain/Interferon-induced transmembrane protein
VKIFVSYARPDRVKAESVSQRLRQAGNYAWLDSELTGGQAWWDEVLQQLRMCDVTVVLISWAALRSQACIQQRRYAASLGKTIIPLTVERIGSELLPPDLARLQVIDYSDPNEEAAFQLLGAIMRAPAAGRLPDPLPEPPPLPTSPLDTIAEELAAPSLSQDRQLAIIGRLESALDPAANSGDRPVALELLDRMAKRPDLLAAVDRRVAALLASAQDTDTAQAALSHQGAAGGWNAAEGQEPAGSWNAAESQGPTGGWNAPEGQGAAGGQAAGSWNGAGGQGAGGSWPEPAGGAPLRQAAGGGAVSPHWAMAITSLILFFPLGIAAIIYSSRTRTSLAAGDLLRARKAATVVKVLFWISIALLVIVIASRA